ncbi:MAG: sigma-70 family RNA polymerase sigma factor [Planctomycetota bacterium]
MQPCTDLVIRVQQHGDREALGELFRTVQEDVYRLVLAELRDPADAADAAQETFRQVVQSLRDLRDPRAFPAWLIRIALEKARTLRRGRQAERTAAAELAERARTTREEPMAHVESTELRGRVREAVDGLEEELRTAVRLRYDHGLSYAEIAQATAAPEGTVAWRLGEAHKRLQKVLSGAGVALALAAIESELQAAEPITVPDRLSRAVAEIAGGAPLTAPGPRLRTRAAGFAVAAVLALLVASFVAPRLGNGGAGAGSGGESGSGTPRPDSTGSTTEEVGETDRTVAGGTGAPVGKMSRVWGRVFDRRTLAPVPGAKVGLLPEGAAAGREKLTLDTDAAGDFSIEVAPGQWRLLAESPSYAGALVERSILRYWRDAHREEFPCGPHASEGLVLEIRDGETVKLDFALGVTLEPDFTLEGTVVNERGDPVAGARVEMGQHSLDVEQVPGATKRKGPFDDRVAIQIQAAVTTNEAGRFHFASVYPRGEIELRATAEGFRADTRLFEVRQGLSADFVLHSGLKLSFEVVDSEARPIAGAHIVAEPAPGADGEVLGITDAGGRFSTDSAAPSTRFVGAWAPGYGWSVAIAAEGNASLRLVLHAATATIRGIVVDEQGAPIAGAKVFVCQVLARDRDAVARFAPGPSASTSDRSEGDWLTFVAGAKGFEPGLSGPDGTFEFRGLPVGNGCGVLLRGWLRPTDPKEENRIGKHEAWDDGWVKLVLSPRD